MLMDHTSEQNSYVIINNKEYLKTITKYFKDNNEAYMRIKYYSICGGKEHMENGPAIEYYYPNGKIKCAVYMCEGEFHREDGPAIITYDKNGNIIKKEYRLHNISITDEFEVIISSDYIGKHEGTVSNYQCKCPQREIFLFLKEFVPNNEVDFIEIENKADQFIKSHILEFIAEVFSNQVVLGNKWTFKTEELKKLNLNFKKIIK